GGPASLASTAHLQVDLVLLHVHQLDKPPVSGHRGVDRGIDQLLHSSHHVCAHGHHLFGESQITTVLDFPVRANWPRVGSAQQNQGAVGRGGLGGWGSSRAMSTRRWGAPVQSSARVRARSYVMTTSSPRSAPLMTAALTAVCSSSMRGSGCVQR